MSVRSVKIIRFIGIRAFISIFYVRNLIKEQAAFDSSLALFTAPAVQRSEPRITNKGELDADFPVSYTHLNVTPSEFITKIESVTKLMYDHTNINQSLQKMCIRDR